MFRFQLPNLDTWLRAPTQFPNIVVLPELQGVFDPLPSGGDLSRDELFTILDYQRVVQRRYSSKNSGVTKDNMLDVDIFTQLTFDKFLKRHYPPEVPPTTLANELRTAVQEALRPLQDNITALSGKITTLDENVTTLNGKITTLDENLVALQQDVSALRRSFGSWAVLQAQDFNARCDLGTGFQLVPFPDGSWPDDEEYPRLTSLDAIQALDYPKLTKYVQKYQLRGRGFESVPVLREKLYTHLGVLRVFERIRDRRN